MADYNFNANNLANNVKPTDKSPVEEKAATQSASLTEGKLSAFEEKERELDKPYIDKRTITIRKVGNYSLYRRVNDKVLKERRDFIGSSITSSRMLAANEEEVNKYFPNILGISPSNQEFIARVKVWLNNISVPVDMNGRTINCSFRYNHYRDYLAIKEEEDKIEEEFNKIERNNLESIKKGVALRIEKLNQLESTKCRYGVPENVEEYLIYRHCLLYKDVCKDLSLINSDSSFRFYIEDVDRERAKKEKVHAERKIAKSNYLAVCGDDALFDAMFVQYCVLEGKVLMVAQLEDRFSKEDMLEKFSSEEPAKFNKLYKDKNLKLKSFIENAIAKGELIRSELNQNITSADGDFIGANMNDAVSYFLNPQNANYKEALEKKLKL